ncbi:DHHC family palmitoyl transferase fused to a KOW domain, signal peptide [Reticulomyxa filosa]|uniref:Palmitoyltransferase n=1 Tax=Reticulomyxa filosa TaxID=46433 RepID=X6P793_RETFI|nr:DHHC family palmitoyl transferase fused to a KOW domain, signal peptide [Reticulomyxa filosa]|eukprot:ETO34375.1 DHHC family palmitoyl transferase fused to a KOW domain, signal peptide [Reticulomyxa filosa]
MCNQKYFLLFLMYTSLCCIFCLSALIWRFIRCSQNQITDDNNMNNLSLKIGEGLIEYSYCNGSPGDIVCCMLNLFEAILFGLFTCIMGCDQFSSIWNNTTYIDIIQNRSKTGKEKKSGYELLQAVFGEPFRVTWFLPTPVTSKVIKDFKSLCMKLEDDSD